MTAPIFTPFWIFSLSAMYFLRIVARSDGLFAFLAVFAFVTAFGLAVGFVVAGASSARFVTGARLVVVIVCSPVGLVVVSASAIRRASRTASVSSCWLNSAITSRGTRGRAAISDRR